MPEPSAARPVARVAKSTTGGTPEVFERVEALIRGGRADEAVRAAYLTAEDDVRRAFGMKLPDQWTHREFLARYLRPDMGYITVLLARLHARFEPVRYGRPGPVSADGISDLLRELYREPGLHGATTVSTYSTSKPASSGVWPAGPPRPTGGRSAGKEQRTDGSEEATRP